MKTKAFVALTEHQLFEEMKDSFTKFPVSTRNAVKALNNLFYMLSTREISENTIRNVYVTLLKGFQSKDQYLKFCMYSAMDELSKYTDEGFVGVNVLINDLSGKMPEEVKAMALRTLFSVIPNDMVYDFEKYVSQAAVSISLIRKDVAVLLTYKLLRNNFSQVRRWMDGVEMLNDPIANYHVVGFLSQLKKLRFKDVENLRGPAGILGVRMSVEALKDSNEALSTLKRFLNSKYSDEMVFIEAAKAVCNLSEEYASQFVAQTVQSLRIFLKSTSVILQFSAMRIISRLALRYPQKVSIANKEIEDLVSSDNRTVSMLAITALLKTGTEETVDRLVGLLPGIIHEMSDTFKKVAIETLESLSNSFESKRCIYINFLESALKQKGELEFKKYIIDVIGRAVECDDVRERILDLLCNYVEDSQYYQVTLDILGIFGRQIPRTKAPGKYVVHVLNRLILENGHVRAAALQCLYDISTVIPSSTVENVMKSCLNDQDEMIREISTFLLRNIELARMTKPFDLDELGDFRASVVKHLDEDEKSRDVANDLLIKECRELVLTEATADLQIKVVKKIYEDKVVFVFSLENKLEGVQICDGLLSFVCNGKERAEMSIRVGQINPLETLVIEKEWSVAEGSVINGVFDHTACVEGDASDTETDSISLEPFQVSILDFVKPVALGSIPNKKKEVSFTLQGDVYTAGKKILDLLNMRITSQETGNNAMTMSLTGEYKNIPIRICVELVCKMACRCSVVVCCDDDEISERIIELFD